MTPLSSRGAPRSSAPRRPLPGWRRCPGFLVRPREPNGRCSRYSSPWRPRRVMWLPRARRGSSRPSRCPRGSDPIGLFAQAPTAFLSASRCGWRCAPSVRARFAITSPTAGCSPDLRRRSSASEPASPDAGLQYCGGARAARSHSGSAAHCSSAPFFCRNGPQRKCCWSSRRRDGTSSPTARSAAAECGRVPDRRHGAASWVDAGLGHHPQGRGIRGPADGPDGSALAALNATLGRTVVAAHTWTCSSGTFGSLFRHGGQALAGC